MKAKVHSWSNPWAFLTILLCSSIIFQVSGGKIAYLIDPVLTPKKKNENLMEVIYFPLLLMSPSFSSYLPFHLPLEKIFIKNSSGKGVNGSPHKVGVATANASPAHKQAKTKKGKRNIECQHQVAILILSNTLKNIYLLWPFWYNINCIL